MSDRLSDEDVERVGRAVERRLGLAISRAALFIVLGLVTIFVAPMLFLMAAAALPGRGAFSGLALMLATLTFFTLAAAWYVFMRRRSSTK